MKILESAYCMAYCKLLQFDFLVIGIKTVRDYRRLSLRESGKSTQFPALCYVQHISDYRQDYTIATASEIFRQLTQRSVILLAGHTQHHHPRQQQQQQSHLRLHLLFSAVSMA